VAGAGVASEALLAAWALAVADAGAGAEEAEAGVGKVTAGREGWRFRLGFTLINHNFEPSGWILNRKLS
jgi:hypothetical protein